MTRLHFVNVVWGAAYTETYVNTCLPSELSEGNLRHPSLRGRASYRIYTTHRDADTILASSAGKLLAASVDLQIVRVDNDLPVDDPQAPAHASPKYRVMSLCHANFIQTVAPTGAALVFLSPDVFWADGSFSRLLEIADSGKRLVMISALRLAKERFIAALRTDHFQSDHLQTVSKRALVALAMQHLHPETQSLIWGATPSNNWPSLLIWKNRDDGLLIRPYHLHPLLVRPERHDVVPRVSIDADYVERVCPRAADEYIVTDSDDILGFELSRESGRAEQLAPTPSSVEKIATWAVTGANSRHHQFVQKKVRLHARDLCEGWRQTERASDDVLAAINARLVAHLKAHAIA